MKKIFLSLWSVLIFAAVNAAEPNFTSDGVTFKSIALEMADLANDLIRSSNAQSARFGHDGISIGNIVPNQLKRVESGNAWHLQLVYQNDTCVALLAFGKISTVYDKPEHDPLNSAFRGITASADPFATCAWAFASNVSSETQLTVFKSMIAYAKKLKSETRPLPLTNNIVPGYLFVLSVVQDDQTNDLLAQAGFTVSTDEAWTLFYDKPRVAAHIPL